MGPLAPERWRRLRPLLDQALDLGTRERLAFLDALAPADQELRADLERLIERHERTSGIREPAAAMAGEHFPPTDPLPAVEARFVGRRVGPFVLNRLLGAGGMGAVYEGQRVDGGFRQTVAIKLVAGVHPGLTARFERERQILAELRHPQIAQLLDGGETDDGMPYFALEYVDGEPITEYADLHGADVDQRLRLLIEVAEALAYAHRRAVIHRDIKPTNILVSADGHVKLLDFGIAKFLKNTLEPTLTQQQIGPMTPEYAAPEQFRGSEVTPATDVYQFGVLMFRLLSGRLPYRAQAQDGLAWARAVSEEEPLSLTEALREARQRAGSESPSGEVTLRRFLTRRVGDLDAIVRRCLAKERTQRYPSMDAVIADLSAYLDAAVVNQPQRRRRLLLQGALVLAAVALGFIAWDKAPTLGTITWTADSAWSEESALLAFGIQPENLHLASAGNETAMRQAFDAEARGELPSAIALFETLHATDRQTPVPALILSYWTSGSGKRDDVLRWRAAFAERMSHIEDPYLTLLARFFEADTDGSFESIVQYSGALLQLRPRAWFLRMARSHHMNARGLTEAALAELKAIDVDRLGHRKLVDAIADRASFGDLPGARALFERLRRSPEDPEFAVLAARLAYTGGDLPAARAHFVQAVALARRVARFDIEARGLLWAGVFSGSLGDLEQASAEVTQAQQRLGDRMQFRYAADAAMVNAHLAALAGDRAATAARIAEARALDANNNPGGPSPLIELTAARLAGAPVASFAAGAVRGPAAALLQSRQALQQGNRAAALAALEQARNAGVVDTLYAEEAAWLAHELGAPAFDLKPIDPPFSPYQRFAARWGLGAGMSVVPGR